MTIVRGIADTDFAGITIASPMAGLIAVSLLLVALGLLKFSSIRRSRRQTDPLAGLFKPEVFECQIAVASEHHCPSPPTFHGQRAQMQRLREVWELDVRAEAIEEVARVMRASKDISSDPLPIVKADPEFDAVEWEEIKLLPPPASHPTSRAA